MHRALPASWPAKAPLVRAVGIVRNASIEPANHPENIDHVWLTLNVGLAFPIEVSINTLSIRSRDAGFDPRIRLGRLRETWTQLPTHGIETMVRFSYADYEARSNIFYESYERAALEQLLLDSAKTCLCTEVIGTPYHRRPLVGLHQIHSRQASYAVTESSPGLDGAIRFYFAALCESLWLFFKFSGQP